MVRWNAGTEHVKTQRQEAPSQALLLGINHLRRMNPVFGQEGVLFGSNCFPVVPQPLLQFQKRPPATRSAAICFVPHRCGNAMTA
jgi:hypothetical protein